MKNTLTLSEIRKRTFGSLAESGDVEQPRFIPLSVIDKIQSKAEKGCGNDVENKYNLDGSNCAKCGLNYLLFRKNCNRCFGKGKSKDDPTDIINNGGCPVSRGDLPCNCNKSKRYYCQSCQTIINTCKKIRGNE